MLIIRVSDETSCQNLTAKSCIIAFTRFKSILLGLNLTFLKLQFSSSFSSPRIKIGLYQALNFLFTYSAACTELNGLLIFQTISFNSLSSLALSVFVMKLNFLTGPRLISSLLVARIVYPHTPGKGGI